MKFLQTLGLLVFYTLLLLVIVTSVVYAVFLITPGIRVELGHYILKYYSDVIGISATGASGGEQLPLWAYWKFYLHWFLNIFVKGDLGYSQFDGKPFSALLGAPIRTTLSLAVVSVLFSLFFALGMFVLQLRWKENPFVRVGIGGFKALSGLHYIVLSYFVLYGLNLRQPPHWILILIIAVGNGVLADTYTVLKEDFDKLINSPFYLGIQTRAGDKIFHLLKPLSLSFSRIMYSKFPAVLGGTFIVEYIMNVHALGLETIKAVVENDHLKMLVISFLITILIVVSTVLYHTVQKYVDPRPVKDL